MRFHTQTAGVSLTAQQPLNNIARTAIEALAGVLGGTQSLHTNSYDEALALPTEGAVRVALRTQQVIAHETGVANTIDPLGGSYFVEALTDRIEAQAYDYFRRIDELGGMVEAVKQNFPQREIADASYELQQEIDAGRRIVVGVNAYTDGNDEDQTPIHKIDAALERKQVDRLQGVRARRDGAAVEARARRAAAGRRDRRRERHAAAAGLRPRRMPARARSSRRSSRSSAATPRHPSSEPMPPVASTPACRRDRGAPASRARRSPPGRPLRMTQASDDAGRPAEGLVLLAVARHARPRRRRSASSGPASSPTTCSAPASPAGWRTPVRRRRPFTRVFRRTRPLPLHLLHPPRDGA